MFRSRKLLLMLGAVFAAALTTALARMSSHQEPAAERRAVFVQAWKTLASNYYDRDMNGLDWRAVRTTYERKLGSASDSFELYWNVLRPMARLLESSHVQLVMPQRQLTQASESRPQVAGPARNLEACAGLWIAEGRRLVATRVIRVDPGSLLHMAGVRQGWRLTNLAEDSNEPLAALVAKFTATTGEGVEILIGPRNGARTPDVSLVRKEFDTLHQLLRSGADPTTEFQMETLGAQFLIGQLGTMPVVAEVVNGSKAERAGIEPGSILAEWSTKQAAGGELHFSAKLVAPAGRSYSASFDFLPCDTQRLGADPAVEQLPGNVLHLRFDTFRPEVIAWLDEQLRAKPDSVVLDLRRNGGGDAAVLLEVMGRFLDPGAHIAQATYRDRLETWTATKAPFVFRGRLAVLVGPLSASAAEVSASALLFHRRATLHGQNTQGSVQLSQEYLLEDGGTVQIAIADVRSPDGHRLENVGVQVSHSVAPTLASIRAGRDVVLESALAHLAPKAH